MLPRDKVSTTQGSNKMLKTFQKARCNRKLLEIPQLQSLAKVANRYKPKEKDNEKNNTKNW
jgi:hypothetical protein